MPLSFQSICLLFFFKYIFSTLLNGSVESRHPCLVNEFGAIFLSFLMLVIYAFSLFSLILAKCLSILLIFSENQLLVSLIFLLYIFFTLFCWVLCSSPLVSSPSLSFYIFLYLIRFSFTNFLSYSLDHCFETPFLFWYK